MAGVRWRRTLPYEAFFIQSTGSASALGTERMFSTALAVMKFLGSCAVCVTGGAV